MTPYNRRTIHHHSDLFARFTSETFLRSQYLESTYSRPGLNQRYGLSAQSERARHSVGRNVPMIMPNLHDLTVSRLDAGPPLVTYPSGPPYMYGQVDQGESTWYGIQTLARSSLVADASSRRPRPDWAYLSRSISSTEVRSAVSMAVPRSV